jgi:hypothetical protein
MMIMGNLGWKKIKVISLWQSSHGLERSNSQHQLIIIKAKEKHQKWSLFSSMLMDIDVKIVEVI